MKCHSHVAGMQALCPGRKHCSGIPSPLARCWELWFLLKGHESCSCGSKMCQPTVTKKLGWGSTYAIFMATSWSIFSWTIGSTRTVREVAKFGSRYQRAWPPECDSEWRKYVPSAPDLSWPWTGRVQHNCWHGLDTTTGRKVPVFNDIRTTKWAHLEKMHVPQHMAMAW